MRAAAAFRPIHTNPWQCVCSTEASMAEDEEAEGLEVLERQWAPAEPRVLYWLTGGRGAQSPPTAVAVAALTRAGWALSYVDDWGKFEYAWIGACRGGVDAVVVDAAGQTEVWVEPTALPAGAVSVLLQVVARIIIYRTCDSTCDRRLA
jgi:hypothetical protein